MGPVTWLRRPSTAGAGHTCTEGVMWCLISKSRTPDDRSQSRRTDVAARARGVG